MHLPLITKEENTMKPSPELEAGTFCWVELGTTNASSAKKFYGGLFGWSMNDVPMGPDSFYTMVQVGGKDVGALYQLGPEQTSQGIAPHLPAYISTKSADESAAKAQSLGGKVLKSAFDVFDVGRMAVLQEPSGATFALWQAKKHLGAGYLSQSGALCWNELATHNVDAAGKFYTKLFGWSSKVQQMGPMAYTIFMQDSRQVGGMFAMGKKYGNAPSHWMPYFAVADCDVSTSKSKSLGGNIEVPPTDLPRVGRVATLQVPQALG